MSVSRSCISAEISFSSVSGSGNVFWDKQVEYMQSKPHTLWFFIWQTLPFMAVLQSQAFSTNSRMEIGSFITSEKLQHFLKTKIPAQKIKCLSTLNLNFLGSLDERNVKNLFFCLQRVPLKIISIIYTILLQVDCRLLDDMENKLSFLTHLFNNN